MKKILFIAFAVFAVLAYSCKKELEVQGPGLTSGPVTITITAPASGEIVSTGVVYTFTGVISAPKGFNSGNLVVLNKSYLITGSGNSISFSIPVTIPENLTIDPNGYTCSVTATDFDDQTVTKTVTFKIAQGLNAFILTPVAGITDPLLSGLTGIFKMRLNYKEPPTGIVLRINYITEVQEGSVNMANPDEFAPDTTAAKNSYLVTEHVTIPNTVNEGTYDFSFVITTSSGDVSVDGKVKVNKISTLYVLGDATTAGWDINNPVPLNNVSPNKFTKSLPLEGSPKGFKFVLKIGSWDVNWGTFETNPINLDQEYALNPGGNNISVAATGNYVINVDFTSGKFKVTSFAPPDSLYLVGGSTPVGWDQNAAAPFTKLSAGIFQIYAPLNAAGGGYKFLPNKGSWNGDWGQKPGFPGVLLQDNEENCPVTADGFYRITVDFNTLTFTTIVTNWGIIGSGVPVVGWNSDTNMTLVGSAEPYTWQFQNLTLVAGEIKFRANDDWGINFGDDGANGTLEYNGANIAVTAGTFNIKMKLDPANWTYTITTKKK
ncbi:MAG: SusF/SusE family outer membrane protein [Bacteroidetes bacterium]|nr:SusF/SusE family outer membrane protein [Bacteroidota bacterium]